MKIFLLFITLFSFRPEWSDQTLQKLDPSNYSHLESDSLYAEASEGYRNLSNSPHVRLQYVTLGLERARKDDNYAAASDFAANAAVVYTEIGMNQEALRSGLEALRYAKRTPTKKDEIWSLYRLSDIRFILQDTARALADAQKALQLSVFRDSLIEVGWSYNCLGEIYRRLPDYDSALYFYQKGLQAFEQVAEKRGVKFSIQNLGLTFAAKGDHDRALEEFDKAEKIDLGIDLLFVLEKGEALTDIIAAKYSLDSAIAYGREMLALAKREAYAKWELKFKAKLATLYRQKPDWENAWQFYLEADTLKEKQTGERVRLQTRVIQYQYEIQLLKAERAVRSQQERNRVILWVALVLVGGLLSMVAVLQITKNKRIRRINAKLSNQNTKLDELLSEKDIWMNLMAHDLKAPLNSIKGLVSLMEEPALDDAFRSKILENISRSVEKGSELISQLLEISRLESGQVTANIQSTNLSELVADIGNTFQPVAAQKSILLISALPAEPVFVETDPVHTQRILENLVSNALKFSPYGKRVEIQLAPMQDTVAIHVVDEGPGLSATDQQSLFQKFKRLSARPTGGESSTGLGLSIVKHLADRIGGQLQVASVQGDGATFSLVLPVRQSGDKPA